MDILKRVMGKYTELITNDLPSWMEFHSLDQNYKYYRPTFEESFNYLTSFASQRVFEKALSILKRNEHYKVVYKDGLIAVLCCNSQDYIPQDLSDKIEALLKLVKAKKALVNELAILPTGTG